MTEVNKKGKEEIYTYRRESTPGYIVGEFNGVFVEIGDIVYLKLLDHATFSEYENIEELYGCEYMHVIGKIVDSDDNYLYLISTWYSDDKGTRNRIRGSKILKKCIVDVVVLSRNNNISLSVRG